MLHGGGDLGDVPLVPLESGQEVGPDGGTLSGDGWTLQVPPGALTEPVSIQVTPLPFTGVKDAVWGIPTFDLSPHGLTFAEPVVFSFDSPLAPHADAPLVLTGLDPTTLAERRHDAALVDGRIVVGLDSFQGEEIRVAPEDQEDETLSPGPTNQWGGREKFCQPFATQEEAAYARWVLEHSLMPFLTTYIGDWNAAMWRRYLMGGTGVVVDAAGVPGFDPAPFTDDPGVFGGFTAVFARARNAYMETGSSPRPLPASTSGAKTYAIDELDPGETVGTRTFEPGQTTVNYFNTLSPAGNAAGGTGSYVLDGVEHPDIREFAGTLLLDFDVTGRGVVRSASLRSSDIGYYLRDAVDLCPGNAGEGKELHATVALSRLESTPKTSGGTWAGAVPFEADLDLPSATYDGNRKSVIGAHRNDEDGDGWPGTQPWGGADFDLDNCRTDTNPGQKDRDKDGLGDVCDPYDCKGDSTGDNPLCDLSVLRSKWTKIGASGNLGGNGATATARLTPTAPACNMWPNRDNWSPTPCYYSVDLRASGTCVYQDPDTKEFRQIGCASLYSEPPGWTTPPISESADTYQPNGQPATSCGAAGAFNTYVYGGDARYPMERWSGRGPTALECRFTWDAARPDAMPGKTFMQILGYVSGPEGPHDGYSEGYRATVSTWVPVRGTIKRD